MTILFTLAALTTIYLLRYTMIVLPRKATERREFEAAMLARRHEGVIMSNDTDTNDYSLRCENCQGLIPDGESMIGDGYHLCHECWVENEIDEARLEWENNQCDE